MGARWSKGEVSGEEPEIPRSPPFAPDFVHVMACLHDTDHSDAVFLRAARLCKGRESFLLTLLTIAEQRDVISGTRWSYVSMRAHVNNQLRWRGEQLLDDYKVDAAAVVGVECRTVCVQDVLSNVPLLIAKAADESKADIVVVGKGRIGDLVNSMTSRPVFLVPDCAVDMDTDLMTAYKRREERKRLAEEDASEEEEEEGILPHDVEEKQEYGEEKQDHVEEKQEYGEEKQDHVEEKQEYGEEKQEYGEEKQDHGEEKQDHGEEKQEYGEEKQDHGEEKQEYGEEKQDHGEESEEPGNKEKDVEEEASRVQDDP